MSCLMEIAVCDIWVFFEAYDIKYIIPVGYFPCIYILGIFLSIVPEKEGLSTQI